MSDVRQLIIPTDADTPDSLIGSLFAETPANVPAAVRGDGETYAIILADPSDTGGSEYTSRAIPAGTAIVLAVGLADQSPQNGTLTLQYASSSTNTGPLPFATLTPLILQNALNALPLRVGGPQVVVTQFGTNYIITDATAGARSVLSADPTLLIPLSGASVSPYRVGSTSQPQVDILSIGEAPYATATSYSALPAAGYTLTSIQAGVTANPVAMPPVVGVASIQLLTLTPEPYGGTFMVDGHLISSTASDLDFANAYGNGVTVTKVDDFSWQFTQSTTGPLTSAVDVSGLFVPTGFLVTLNLSTNEFLFAFANNPTQDPLNAKISLQVTFPGQLPKTFLLAPIEVYRSVINVNALISAALPGLPISVLQAMVAAYQAGTLGNIQNSFAPGIISVGDNGTQSLERQVTVGVTVPVLKTFTILTSGEEQDWQLYTGTDATDSLHQRPNDYNAPTNAKVWVRKR